MSPINVPKNQPLSRDIIDRRKGQKPSLKEKVRDVAIAVRNDWNDAQDIEKRKKGVKTKTSSLGIPSYKKGGIVRSTGPALLHKGERVIPKNQAKRVSKQRKRTRRKS